MTKMTLSDDAATLIRIRVAVQKMTILYTMTILYYQNDLLVALLSQHFVTRRTFSPHGSLSPLPLLRSPGDSSLLQP